MLLVRLDGLERLMKAAFAYLHGSIYILFRTLIFALDVVDLREMSEVAHLDELHLVLRVFKLIIILRLILVKVG